jgi:hypothetical protein
MPDLTVILGCLILPPTNHLDGGWERFDKVVTRLLGLAEPINLTCGQYKSKLIIGTKITQSLIDTCEATTLEPQNSHDPLLVLPFRVIHFPLLARPVTSTIHKHTYKPLLIKPIYSSTS